MVSTKAGAYLDLDDKHRKRSPYTKRACTNCQQKKLKCQNDNLGGKCARCKKFGLTCTYTERKKKRKPHRMLPKIDTGHQNRIMAIEEDGNYDAKRVEDGMRFGSSSPLSIIDHSEFNAFNQQFSGLELGEEMEPPQNPQVFPGDIDFSMSPPVSPTNLLSPRTTETLDAVMKSPATDGFFKADQPSLALTHEDFSFPKSQENPSMYNQPENNLYNQTPFFYPHQQSDIHLKLKDLKIPISVIQEALGSEESSIRQLLNYMNQYLDQIVDQKERNKTIQILIAFLANKMSDKTQNKMLQNSFT